jgi:hypothetical protein
MTSRTPTERSAAGMEPRQEGHAANDLSPIDQGQDPVGDLYFK